MSVATARPMPLAAPVTIARGLSLGSVISSSPLVDPHRARGSDHLLARRFEACHNRYLKSKRENGMSADDERLQRGVEMMRQVYGDVVPVPQGSNNMPFQNLMLKNLFADVWGRDAMSIRDRRLVVIGAIAAIADVSLIEIQLRAALANGELQRDQLREIPLILTQYIGYPRTVPVMMTVERLLAETADRD
jgi:4-carboxymuconolactone decarboxylase